MKNDITHTTMFTDKQQQHDFLMGQARRQRLVTLGQAIRQVDTTDKYPHFYIYSKPGLGKTHTITKALEGSKHEIYHLSAAESMFVFGVHLAVLNHNIPKNKTIMVVLDDAENLLGTTENINIFKNMLDGHKIYKYSKRMDSTVAGMSEGIQEAVRAHITDGEVGFSVPTNRFCFVFTSNIKLPNYNDLEKKLTPAKYNRTMHLLAIRDRVRPVDFDLEAGEMWGWIADTVLTENACEGSDPKVIKDALDFTYNNWPRLKTKSIRLIQQMVDEAKRTDDYVSVWESDYIL